MCGGSQGGDDVSKVPTIVYFTAIKLAKSSEQRLPKTETEKTANDRVHM